MQTHTKVFGIKCTQGWNVDTYDQFSRVKSEIACSAFVFVECLFDGSNLSIYFCILYREPYDPWCIHEGLNESLLQWSAATDTVDLPRRFCLFGHIRFREGSLDQSELIGLVLFIYIFYN